VEVSWKTSNLKTEKELRRQYQDICYGDRLGMDGTGSGSCPVAGFGISGVETLGSATTVLVRSYGDRL
jgi:hypothetical protein